MSSAVVETGNLVLQVAAVVDLQVVWVCMDDADANADTDVQVGIDTPNAWTQHDLCAATAIIDATIY